MNPASTLKFASHFPDNGTGQFSPEFTMHPTNSVTSLTPRPPDEIETPTLLNDNDSKCISCGSAPNEIVQLAAKQLQTTLMGPLDAINTDIKEMVTTSLSAIHTETKQVVTACNQGIMLKLDGIQHTMERLQACVEGMQKGGSNEPPSTEIESCGARSPAKRNPANTPVVNGKKRARAASAQKGGRTEKNKPVKCEKGGTLPIANSTKKKSKPIVQDKKAAPDKTDATHPMKPKKKKSKVSKSATQSNATGTPKVKVKSKPKSNPKSNRKQGAKKVVMLTNDASELAEDLDQTHDVVHSGDDENDDVHIEQPDAEGLGYIDQQEL